MAVPDFLVTVTTRDSERKLSSTNYFYNGTAAQALIYASNLATKQAAISTGVIAKVETTNLVSVDPSVPTGNQDNEIKGAFTFYNTDGVVMRVSVPCFDRSKLIPNTSEIDTNDVAVDEFIGVLTNTVGAVDSRAIAIDSLKSALEAYGNRQQ